MKSPWVLPVCCALLVTACASSRELEDLSRARVVADLTQRGVPDADAAIEEQEVTALLEDGLSEEDAVRLALGHNRQTRAALAQLGIGAGELAAAGLWANPMLHGKLLFFDGGTEIDLGISQSLGRFLLLPAMRERSEAEQQALEAQVAALVLEVVHRARKAHVQATQAWRDLELRVAEEAAARGADELMKDLEQAGNIQPVRGATSAADLARRQLDTMDGERAWQHSREELNRACGLSSNHAQWELRPEPLIRSLGGRVVDAGLLDGLDLENVEDRAVEASLALRQSRARMDAQAKLAELNGWKGRWADTELGAAALKEADSGTYGLGPSFSIPLPIADTGNAGAHAARARLQGMLEEYSSTVVELRSSARELSTRLRMLAASEQHAREVLLPAERRLVEETLRNFNAMQVGAFDVLHARAAEIEAERRHLELRTQTRIARLELETMLAGAGHLYAQGAKQ